MEAVLDTGFSLLYRDQVLNFLLPLFPAPSSRTKSSHIHSLARLLVTLNNPSLTVPLLTSLVPKERLLAYQFAFDLAEGGTRDFLEGVRKHLPEGTEVGFPCPHDSDSFVTDRGKQETKNIYDKLRNILGGQESVKLYLEFLKRTNKVDMLILKNSKVAIRTTGPIMQLILFRSHWSLGHRYTTPPSHCKMRSCMPERRRMYSYGKTSNGSVWLQIGQSSQPLLPSELSTRGTSRKA